MSRTVVCLTGGIGSGKSAVAAAFARRGIEEVDTDRIAHQLTAPGGAAIAALCAAFGPAVLNAEGAMDRARMRQRVFADAGARSRLEGILHPLIRQRADQACQDADSPYVLLAVPLLVEALAAGDYRACCRRILVIDCDPARQLERVQARSGLGADEVRAILAAQATREARLAIADDILNNDGSLDALDEQVGQLHLEYLMLSCSN